MEIIPRLEGKKNRVLKDLLANPFDLCRKCDFPCLHSWRKAKHRFIWLIHSALVIAFCNHSACSFPLYSNQAYQTRYPSKISSTD